MKLSPTFGLCIHTSYVDYSIGYVCWARKTTVTRVPHASFHHRDFTLLSESRGRGSRSTRPRTVAFPLALVDATSVDAHWERGVTASLSELLSSSDTFSASSLSSSSNITESFCLLLVLPPSLLPLPSILNSLPSVLASCKPPPLPRLLSLDGEKRLETRVAEPGFPPPPGRRVPFTRVNAAEVAEKSRLLPDCFSLPAAPPSSAARRPSGLVRGVSPPSSAVSFLSKRIDWPSGSPTT